MTLKSAPFYWVECDGPKCPDRCPVPDSGVSAWEDDSTPVDEAREDGWTIDDDGRHFCPDHRPEDPDD